MRVLYINNDGGGYCDYVDVEPGTTLDSLFHERVPYGEPGDYLIRINRLPTAGDYVLQEGDRVSITPVKIEGAVA